MLWTNLVKLHHMMIHTYLTKPLRLADRMFVFCAVIFTNVVVDDMTLSVVFLDTKIRIIRIFCKTISIGIKNAAIFNLDLLIRSVNYRLA